MRRRRLAAALLSLFLLAAATAYPATTTKKKTVKVSGTIRAVPADTSDSTNPKLAGTLTDKVLGSGAVVADRVNLTGARAKARFTVFAKNGSFSGTATFDNTANPDGSSTISNGTIAITRGGGIYKHPKGSVTFQGSIDAQAHVTLTYSGKLTYNRK
jgi:hypothetical protein